MESIKASSKGQMVIPKAIREALGIHRGTKLNIELLPNRSFKVTVRASDHVAQVRRLAGSLAHRAKRMTSEEEQAVLLAAVRADDERIRRTGRRRR